MSFALLLLIGTAVLILAAALIDKIIRDRGFDDLKRREDALRKQLNERSARGKGGE